jgi:hypothetical protein
MGVYPFQFSAARDFEPIVEEMTKVPLTVPNIMYTARLTAA